MAFPLYPLRSTCELYRRGSVIANVIHLRMKMPFPVDSKWVAETESKLGIRFPASFVVAMCKRNGGSVNVDNDVFFLHPFLDKSDKKRIQRTCNSICRETASLRDFEFFQTELVAIGHNGTGDALVLKPMNDDPTCLDHSVYLWHFETSEIELVADDFAELSRCG